MPKCRSWFPLATGPNHKVVDGWPSGESRQICLTFQSRMFVRMERSRAITRRKGCGMEGSYRQESVSAPILKSWAVIFGSCQHHIEKRMQAWLRRKSIVGLERPSSNIVGRQICQTGNGIHREKRIQAVLCTQVTAFLASSNNIGDLALRNLPVYQISFDEIRCLIVLSPTC